MGFDQVHVGFEKLSLMSECLYALARIECFLFFLDASMDPFQAFSKSAQCASFF
jgi:hypothetical protein